MQVSATKGNKNRLTFRQRIGLVESSALKSLAATIEARRSCLETEFQNKDPQSKGSNRALLHWGIYADELFGLLFSGTISIKDWCEAMQAGTGLSVPWRLLRERVLSPQAAEEAGKSGLIAYAETFKGPGSVSATLFLTH